MTFRCLKTTSDDEALPTMHPEPLPRNKPSFKEHTIAVGKINFKEVLSVTKKYNKGSMNQNSPRAGHNQAEFSREIAAGDNSKGNKHNKDQNDKTDRD